MWRSKGSSISRAMKLRKKTTSLCGRLSLAMRTQAAITAKLAAESNAKPSHALLSVSVEVIEGLFTSGSGSDSSA
ncbi:MAG: hypothetical protein CO017_04115 [Zetaproteobacteria bacterium CG_4_8_14_3_um_filter_59_5]|nr:MAG: hypothetical protein CO017_04115 [Zetaproteobacteria bacterium CG_4_8_14_3_um_filter_59_5]